jgi:hypothetical protein
LNKLAVRTVDSPLSEEDIVVLGNSKATGNEELIAALDEFDDSIEEQEKASSESSSKNSGGRRVGSTIQGKKAMEKLITHCITKVTEVLDKAHQRCYQSGRKRLRNGALDRIIKEIEKKNMVKKGTMNRETVKSRVTQGNLNGINLVHLSPLFLIEEVIIKYCILLAKIGSALTKEEVSYAINELSYWRHCSCQ